MFLCPPQMIPKSKRKSILVRMLRPVSVAFGEKKHTLTAARTRTPKNPSQTQNRVCCHESEQDSPYEEEAS